MLLGKTPIGTASYLGGIPAVLEEFCWSWSALREYSSEVLCEPDEFIFYDRSTISTHSTSRNLLVSRMMGPWLLQLDTDHVVPPDLLVRMVDRMETYKEIDVLTAMYQFKKYPHSPVAFLFNKDNNELEPLGEWEPGSIIEVGAAGAGALLVKRKVFERIASELKQRPFDIIPPYSEDLSFFIRLKQLGIKVYCDTKIEYKHIRTHAIGLDDFDKNYYEMSDVIKVDSFKEATH